MKEYSAWRPLRALFLTLFVVGGFAGASESLQPETQARHVVFVVFDTLRADRMSVYGYEKETTPFLKESQSKLLKFTRAKAVAPWTMPSHASIFTGLMPSKHRAQWGRLRLGPKLTTLAEILRDSGFKTVSLASNPFFKENFGLTQGFEESSVMDGSARDKSAKILAALPSIIEETIDDENRLFLFLNFMDAHIPYNHFRYGREFGLVAKPPIRNAKEKWQVSAGDRELTPLEIGQHGAAYDAAVRYLDDIAREINLLLEESGILDQTLVIFTSDHGEGLGHHQQMGHSISVWEEQLAIPLLIRLPKAHRGGEVVSSTVSLVGLTPFILDRLDISRPKRIRRAASLEATAEDLVIADYRSYFGNSKRQTNVKMAKTYPELVQTVRPLHVVYCGFNKLVVDDRGGIGFFNLEIDPHEQHNLAGKRTPALQSCFDQYQDMLSKGQFTAFSETGSDVENDEKQEAIERDALRALGYVH